MNLKNEQIDIIANFIQVVSILNKTDKYMDSLFDKLSECDSLVSDYEHFIENTPIEQVDLESLYLHMQENFKKRRNIKNDITLKDNYQNLLSRWTNSANREFLIQGMKRAKEKLGTNYKNRKLSCDDIQNLMKQTEKKKVGRPKKEKEGV